MPQVGGSEKRILRRHVPVPDLSNTLDCTNASLYCAVRKVAQVGNADHGMGPFQIAAGRGELCLAQPGALFSAPGPPFAFFLSFRSGGPPCHPAAYFRLYLFC